MSHESAPQTASRSVQAFLHGSRPDRDAVWGADSCHMSQLPKRHLDRFRRFCTVLDPIEMPFGELTHIT